MILDENYLLDYVVKKFYNKNKWFSLILNTTIQLTTPYSSYNK